MLFRSRDPVAAARLARCREVVVRIAGEHTLPAENLIAPDSIRRLAWQPPEEVTDDTVAETLRGFNAREWQISLLLPALTEALAPLTPIP